MPASFTLRQNTITDYPAMTVAMTGIAVPSFVMAPLLTLIFGVTLMLLPIATLDIAGLASSSGVLHGLHDGVHVQLIAEVHELLAQPGDVHAGGNVDEHLHGTQEKQNANSKSDIREPARRSIGSCF